MTDQQQPSQPDSLFEQLLAWAEQAAKQPKRKRAARRHKPASQEGDERKAPRQPPPPTWQPVALTLVVERIRCACCREEYIAPQDLMLTRKRKWGQPLLDSRPIGSLDEGDALQLRRGRLIELQRTVACCPACFSGKFLLEHELAARRAPQQLPLFQPRDMPGEDPAWERYMEALRSAQDALLGLG